MIDFNKAHITGASLNVMGCARNGVVRFKLCLEGTARIEEVEAWREQSEGLQDEILNLPEGQPGDRHTS